MFQQCLCVLGTLLDAKQWSCIQQSPLGRWTEACKMPFLYFYTTEFWVDSNYEALTNCLEVVHRLEEGRCVGTSTGQMCRSASANGCQALPLGTHTLYLAAHVTYPLP